MTLAASAAAGAGGAGGPDPRPPAARPRPPGAASASPAGGTDGSAATAGRLTVIEHTVAPGVLAGPLHHHSREDEYSYVLEGRLGAVLGDEEVFAGPGDLVFKPRGQWHTFWNPGDTPTRVLELITPSGLEDLFRELGALGEMDPATLPALAARYGCEVDFQATAAIIQRHGLTF